MRPVAVLPLTLIAALLLSPSNANGLNAHRRTETRPENLNQIRAAQVSGPRLVSHPLSSRSWPRPLIVAPTVPPASGFQLGKAAPRDTEAAQSAQPPVVAVPLPATPTRGPAGTGDGTPAGLSALQLKIRWCESRDNYQAQNSASTASGAWEFLDSTWHSNSHLPGHARDYPQAVQDRVFLLVFAEQGTRPWVSSESCWR